MDQIKVKQPFEIPHEGNELTRITRQKIDDNILSLKMRRNDLSPIYALPPEVLSKIFILVRGQSIEVGVYNDQAPWICVGQVCHHWREVALSCPSLWSIPVFTKPDLAQEMMQRSKMAPLSIISAAGNWTPRMREQLENAMAQVHRIQSIDLTLGFHPQKLETIFSPLSQPTPLLEEISFCDNSVDGSRVSFPMGALTNAPRLRSIEFHSLNFSWESAVFGHKNLTDVRLIGSYNLAATDGGSTFGQMMDALYCLPYLRVLQLIDSIPLHPHPTSSGNERILEFKFLEQLDLHTEAVNCIFLLRHIRYPPGASVTLHSISTAAEDRTPILSLIGQNLRRTQSVEAEAPIIRSAQLSSSQEDISEISYFNGIDGINHLYLSLGTFITIRLSGAYHDLREACDSFLTTIYECFDLSSLQALLVDLNFSYGHIHMIRDSFRKLPKLDILKVSELCLPGVFFALAESLEDTSAERPEETQALNPWQTSNSQRSFPPATVFPALRTLSIEGVDFRNNPENMDRLFIMLKKRSDMNAPIDRLNLEQCRGVPAWQKRLLGKLVVDLEVDGEVIDVNDLDSKDDRDDEDDRDWFDERDYPSDDDYFSEP